MGKTTCAAAAAVAAARRGGRVLIVSTDPAHSLGDALARPLGPRPTRVPTRAGALHAAELDADRALARWLRPRRRSLARIAERGTYLDDEDVERFLGLSLPGIDELVGLLELTRLGRTGPWDEVIVDTAPTGHTLRLLEMPATLRRIARVFDDMQAKHRFLARSLGGGYRPDATDALIEEIDADGRDLAALLRDRRRSTFTWLLLPELLALEEARDAIGALEGQGISVDEIVVNRVTPPPPRPCPGCRARIAAEQAAIGTIRRSFRGRPLRFLPAQPAEPRGVAALARVAEGLESPTRGEALAGTRSSPGPRTPASPAGPPPGIDTLAPPGLDCLFFGGKGGVGKTSCAAAVAIALAERSPRRRILLLSTDPAHSLADVLQAALGDEARAVAGVHGQLRAREMDAERVFRRQRARYRRAIDGLFDAIGGGAHVDPAFDRVVMQDLVELAPPGLDELFAMLSMIEAVGTRPEDGGGDLLVMDTAPTGHALRLLAMPATALEWVHALLAILLKYRAVVGLGGLAADLLEISRELRQLQALLRDPGRTRFVAVTRGAELPRLETARLLRALRSLGIAPSALVVNAVTPDAGGTICARCRRAAAEERRAVKALGREGLPLILAPLRLPPPRGVTALRDWSRSWSTRER